MTAFAPVFDSPGIARLGLALIHSLWICAMIAAILALVLPVFRGRPSIRHGLAWLALLLMAASVPAAAWWMPGIEVLQGPGSGDHPRPDLDPAIAIQPGGAPAARVFPPSANLSASPAMAVPPPSRTAGSLPDDRPRDSNAKVVPRGSPADPARLARRLAPWAVCGWLAGMLGLSAWRLGGWISLRSLRDRATRAVPDEVERILERVAALFEIGRAVRAVESARIDVPAVIGWLRPVILLPAGVVTGMSTREVELILAHELAHVRRSDFLANLIQTAIETALFYHPAAWWASAVIRHEREVCCDEIVVGATGERLLYAKTLANLAENRLRAQNSLPALLPLAAVDGQLLVRIRNILGLPDERRRRPARQAAGSILVLALAVLAIGYAASNGAPPAAPMVARAEPKIAEPEKAAASKGGERPAKKAEAPAVHVVSVYPPDGAVNVDPKAEIRVRFDRPMDPTTGALTWDLSVPAGFRYRGPARYLAETREFAFPADLKPGCKHTIQFNPGGMVGFRSADGVEPSSHSWSFATARPPAGSGPAPRTMSIFPEPDTEVAELTLLSIRFDRPMDPASYGIRLASSADRMGRDQLELSGRPEYEAERRQFRLLVRLPSHWNGDIRLEGFRSEEGVEMAPEDLPYRTRAKSRTNFLMTRIMQDWRSPELRRVVEKAREARRKLLSVDERLITTTVMPLRSPGWNERFAFQGSTFKMSGDRKFLGIVEMPVDVRPEGYSFRNVPFTVGSDGRTCWHRFLDRRVDLPFDDVAEKNVLLCDPFDAKKDVDAEHVIVELWLDYRGEVEVRGRKCHAIRQWRSMTRLSSAQGMVQDWFLDAETFLPARHEVHFHGIHATDFAYSRVNQPIPDEEFRPPPHPGMPIEPARPLEDGYDRRFLNVIDGSHGRMSVRWGMMGRKGRNSSGMN